MRVYSVFSSIQGESTRAGLPCTFIRLVGCPIGCSYCDTKEAADSSAGKEVFLEDLLNEARKKNNRIVEVTGGEPLFQEETPQLLEALCGEGFEVLLETSGAYPVKKIDDRVVVIMDCKCPSSKAGHKMLEENLEAIVKRKRRSEVKFVLQGRKDFDYACDICNRYELWGQVEVLFSPVWDRLEPDRLAEWILEEGVDARLQIQLHKVLWPRGENEK